MKPNKILAMLIACAMAFSLAVAHANTDRKQLRDSRSVIFPAHAILDEQSEPLISSDGKSGFISSVTGGSLISFSMKTGKVISSVVVGNTIGPISMVEAGKQRLIAVPAVNDPDRDHPATISIIDATNARQLNLKSLLVLPTDAHITTTTRAVLTEDGKFCLIASSFNLPELYSFNVETGEMISELPLFGRPSEMAFYEDEQRRAVALVSAETNHLSIFRVDEEGRLSSAASFTPSEASFSDSNNPVFDSNGRALYIAASDGNQLLAIDADSGAQFGSVNVPFPQRITVASLPDGGEIIAVTRARRPVDGSPGGVTIVSSRGGSLAIQSEFAPPSDIEFSRANNVEFDDDASVAFVGSVTGVLFAFSTETGELEAHQTLGSELRRVALHGSSRTVATVRSSSKGDEVVIVGFDVVGDDDEPEMPSPAITSLKPDLVQQGRLKNLRLVVNGENFDNAIVLVNGIEVETEQARKGKSLAVRLSKEMFNQPGGISIHVRGINGNLSGPAVLSVVRPADPTIEKISPEEVPGPTEAFNLKVTGNNFRPSSTIFVAGRPLNTERTGNKTLQAKVPSELAGSVNRLTVQVKDLAVPDAVSNEKELNVFGPRIRELKTNVSRVVAGANGFKLNITGDNFRNGAQVEINGAVLPANKIRRASRTSIRLNVPRRLFQNAGKLNVVVRNPEGNASEPSELTALAPEIKAFAPELLLAGTSDLKIDIRGENFRRRARVYVGNDDGLAFQVAKQRVRFRSDSRIVVTVSEELNKLLKKPGQLKFQVVNPNDGDGVPSAEQSLEVAGPEIEQVSIKTVRGDDSRVNVIINGAHFRKGALVEFVKAGDVFRQDTPVKLGEGRLVITLRAKKLSALAGFQLRVINPGKVRSNEADLPTAEAASNED